MKLIISKLKTLLKERRSTKKELARILGITENGLQYILKNETLKVKDLLTIAKSYGVNVNYFFTNKEESNPYQLINTTGDSSPVSEIQADYNSTNEKSLLNKISQLQKENKMQAEQIESLKEFNDFLKNKK